MPDHLTPPTPGTNEAGVLALLKRRPKRGVTELDVLRACHTTQGAAYIYRLRRRGYNIIMETERNPRDHRRWYGRYRLVEVTP